MAQSHHSTSDRWIESVQLAGRPVDLYVSDALTAKNSARAVHPVEIAIQARRPSFMRLLGWSLSFRTLLDLLELGEVLFGEIALRRFGERGAIVLPRLVAIVELLVFLADEHVDLRGCRIEFAVHFEHGDR